MTTAPGFVPPPAARRPLTVAYVGNFTRPWCTEVHVAASLRANGHKVIELQENRTPWSQVVDTVNNVRADMVLWTRTWPAEMGEVAPQLERLAEMGVPTVSYHLDRWFGLDREHQVRDQPFFRSALVVSPDDSPRWADEGVNHLWLPPGVFDQECHPVRPDRLAYPAPVVFVGSHPYPHPEWAGYRSELIHRMTEAFPDRFAVLPRKGKPIRGKALQQLYATVDVVVGDSCLAGESYRYWSDRVPETIGRGGVLLHPEVGDEIGPAGEWYESGVHLLTYELGDFDAAVAAVEWAMVDGEAAAFIREQGRARVLSRDTYRHRLATVVDHVADTLGFPVWPEPAVAPPPESHQSVRMARHRVAAGGGRWRAMFELRAPEGGIDDRMVVDEVWQNNDYRVDPRRRLAGTVLDIGANIGAFSILAAKAGAERVFSFEPHPANRARLVRHAELNHVTLNVDPRAVVGDETATPAIALAGDGGGAHRDEDDPGAVAVPTVSLRTILAATGPVSFVKLDAEGAEYDLLAGPHALTAHELHVHVERMAIEFHGPVMPHLGHLDDDGGHLDRWKQMVALLADCGRTEIHGHPTVGGLIHWGRY